MTARHELQVELKKLEGDYEHKLQDLSQEKEQLASSKLEREKENQGLQQQLSTLQQQVHTNTYTHTPVHVGLSFFLIQIAQNLSRSCLCF